MKWGLKGGISIYGDSGPPKYVLWCCGCVCHEVLTFIQFGCGHTVLRNIFNCVLPHWRHLTAGLFYFSSCKVWQLQRWENLRNKTVSVEQSKATFESRFLWGFFLSIFSNYCIVFAKKLHKNLNLFLLSKFNHEF